ncbi:tetraspanin-8-like, partial [Tachysurus ichikawai]
ILGGLMSLMMIITINIPTISQMPAMALSYQPPKYSEVVNY